MGSLALYQAMSQLSAQMVSAARAADWEQLIALEKDVAGLRDHLQLSGQPAGLSPTEREEAVSLIRRILADDQQIREFTEPWMCQIGRYLGVQRRSAPSRIHASADLDS